MIDVCNCEKHLVPAYANLDWTLPPEEIEWSFLQDEDFADLLFSDGPALLLETHLLYGHGVVEVQVSADMVCRQPGLEASHDSLLRTSESVGYQREHALVVETAVIVGPIRPEAKSSLFAAILDGLNEGRELLLDEVRRVVEAPFSSIEPELVDWIRENHPGSAELFATLIGELRATRHPLASFALEQIEASKAVFAQ